MKSAYLYCDPRSLNDATNYYVAIIRDCLNSIGYNLSVCHDISEIKHPDAIFTITARYFFVANIRFPFAKSIFWAQGVSAAECRIGCQNFKSRVRYVVRKISERCAINHSSVLFCVSHRMLQYYKDTYALKNVNKCIVMPCYNLQLSSSFNLSQYNNPSFVYAGGASVWQGVDLMLDVFARVQKELPGASLTICTSDYNIFKNKIEFRNIKNYKIKYIPVSELQQELHRHKYGFIIREKNIVNEVATPTKMNSYLANYVIPIFSDAVEDFKNNIKLDEFTIMANSPLDVYSIARKIVDFEKTEHDYNKYRSIVEVIFKRHYNDQYYKDIIKDKFTQILLPNNE